MSSSLLNVADIAADRPFFDGSPTEQSDVVLHWLPCVSDNPQTWTNVCNSTLFTSSSDDSTEFSTLQVTSIGLGAGAVILLTILGNLVVLVSFIIDRTIRQPTNYFIASLACSDMLIGTVSMPFYTVYLLAGQQWPLGEVLCDLWLSIDYTACLCSIYTVLCITIDRFCSVKIPAKYRNWRTEGKVIKIVCVTWVVPAILFFTSIFGWQYFVGVRTVKPGMCYVQYMENVVFNTLLQVVYFWITLAIICTLYVCIYRVASKLNKKSVQKFRQHHKSAAASFVTMAAGPASIKDPDALPQHQIIEMTAADPRGLNHAIEFGNGAQLQVPTNVGKRNRRKSFLMSRRISSKKPPRRVVVDKDIEQDLSSVALPSDGDSLSPKLRSPVNQKDFPLPSPELCLLLGPSDVFAKTRREERGEPNNSTTTNNQHELMDAENYVGGVNMTSFPTSEKNEDDPAEFDSRRNCWKMEIIRITRLSLDDSAIDLHSGNERGDEFTKTDIELRNMGRKAPYRRRASCLPELLTNPEYFSGSRPKRGGSVGVSSTAKAVNWLQSTKWKAFNGGGGSRLQIQTPKSSLFKGNRTEDRAKKALRTISRIVGAFVLCWTPWHVLSLIYGFCPECVNQTLYDISYWLCYLNSPMNPFCYALANQQFKKTFIRIIKLDWHKT